MNILFLTDSFYPATQFGGPIFSSLNLLNTLSKRGHVINVLSFFRYLDFDQERRSAAIEKYENYTPKFFFFTIYGFFRFMISAYRMQKDANVIIVNGVFCKFIIPSLFLFKLLGRNFIIIPRGSLQYPTKFTLKKRIYLTVVRFLISNTDQLIWTSQYEKHTSLFNYFKSDIIPNIVDLGSGSFKSSGVKQKDYLLYVGRLHQVKNIPLILESFALFLTKRNENREYRLKIAGSGEKVYFYHLRELTKKLGIEKYVDFLGEVVGTDKVILFENASLTFLVSESENFGNAVLESLLCRTPVIVSENTFWASLASSPCISVCDLDALSVVNSIEDLLKRSLFDESFTAVTNRFSKDAVADAWERVFQK